MPASSAKLDQVRAAKSKAMVLFKGVRSLRGIGIAKDNGRYMLKVNLGKKPIKGTPLPSEVDGVPVLFEVVGEISKRTVEAG